MLVRTKSQVTIPLRTLAIVPAMFNSTSNHHYYLTTSQKSQESQQIYGTKLILCLLCTTINTSPDNVILPQNWNIGEMRLLSNTDGHLNPSAISEVTRDISSDHIDEQWMQQGSYSSTPCKVHGNQ